jgi:hypothetical protein
VVQVQNQAHELLGKADAEIAALKQQVQQLTVQSQSKATENIIKDYQAETDRLKALGTVDPELVKMIARQLWETMAQTDIMPHMARHTAFEQSLQPPPEPEQANGAGNGSGNGAVQ